MPLNILFNCTIQSKTPKLNIKITMGKCDLLQILTVCDLTQC